jgi:hypothetical protein
VVVRGLQKAIIGEAFAADTSRSSEPARSARNTQCPSGWVLEGRNPPPRPWRNTARLGAGGDKQIAAGARGSFAFLWGAHNSGGLACGSLQWGQSRLSLHSSTVHLPPGGMGRAPPRVGGAWGMGPRAAPPSLGERLLHRPSC